MKQRIKDGIKKVYYRTSRVQREAFLKAMTYIAAAFGLVAGLAWNEAIKELIDQYFKASSNIISKFIYAVFVTIIVVAVTMYISRLQDRMKR